MTMKKTNDNNNNTTETNSSQSSSKLQLFTYMDSLYLLTDLFNYGLITQEEYERKREKISNEMYATSSSSSNSSSSDDSIPQQPSHDDDADEWDDDKKQEISDRVAKLCEPSQMKVLDFLLEQVPDKLERRNNQAHLDLSEMNDEMCSRLMQLIVNLEERDNRYSPIQPDIIVHVPAVNHFLSNTTICNNTNNNTNNNNSTSNSTDSTNNNNSPDRKRQRSNSYSEESPENIDHDERDRKRVKRSPYTKAFYEQLFSNNLYNYYTKSPM